MSSCLVRLLAITALLPGATYAFAQVPAGPSTVRLAALPNGYLHGIVVDDLGAALDGVHVLAMGTTVAAAVTDRRGHFDVALPIGPYLLSVQHPGYLPARRGIVQIAPNRAVEQQITLVRDDRGAVVPQSQNQSDIAWRLRHLSRTVLRNESPLLSQLEKTDSPAERVGWGGGARTTLGRFESVAAFFTETPFTGHVNLFTTAPVGAVGVPGGRTWSTGAADVAIGAPVGNLGDWQVRGTMSTGGASAWGLLGEYRARKDHRHGLQLQAAYRNQAVSAFNGLLPAADPGTRTAVGLRVSNRWQLRSWLEVSHAVRVDRDEAVTASSLISPSVGVRVGLIKNTIVTASTGQAESGPQTSALLPDSPGGAWSLPFAPSAAWRTSVAPQRVRTRQVGVERQLVRRWEASAGLDWFAQSVEDQMAVVYRPSVSRDAGYDVLSAGDAAMVGWRLHVAGRLPARVGATLQLTSASSRWLEDSLSIRRTLSVGRGAERVDSLQTSFTWSSPLRTTLVMVRHRVSHVQSRDAVAGSGVFRRQQIALEFQQRSPLQPLDAGIVTLFFDLRSALYGDASASLYDDLLVTGNPARVSGGLQLQF